MTEDVLLSTKGASLKGSIEVKKMELEDAFAGFEPVTSESETVDIGEVNKQNCCMMFKRKNIVLKLK